MPLKWQANSICVLKPHTWVKAIDAEAHVLELEKDAAAQQPYAKLILAVGANPLRLAIAGDGSDDIHVVNNLSDYTAFRQQLEQRQDKTCGDFRCRFNWL